MTARNQPNTRQLANNEPTRSPHVSLLTAALDYARGGLPVFPCRRADKSPLTRHGFKDATTDTQQIRNWWREWSDAMIGMPTGRVSGIDVLDLDLKPDEYIDGREFVPNWRELSPVIVRTPSGGVHGWFKSAGTIRSSSDQIAPGVDTRGEGGYAIVPPSRHRDGDYSFINGDINDIGRLPTFPRELFAKLGPRHEGCVNANPEANPENLRAAMQVIPNPDLGWDEWKKFGLAIWRATRGSEAGFAIWNEWSACSTKYHADNTRRAWDGITRSPPARIGAGTIFYQANQNDPGWQRSADDAADPDDAAQSDENDEQRERRQQKSQVMALLSLTPSPPGGGLFHTKDKIGYADIVIDGHRETWKIKSNMFKQWLRYKFFQLTGAPPTTQPLNDAIEASEARANFDDDAVEREVFIRVAEHAGKIYLDLCNEEWQVVEISADGWRVMHDPPVRFRRVKGMLPLPVPQRGGSLAKLRPFINVKADSGEEGQITDSLSGPLPVPVRRTPMLARYARTSVRR